MTAIVSNPTRFTGSEVKVDFIVNEFPRVKVPAPKSDEPQDFRKMSKIQRQLIVKRLIEHVDQI